MNPSRALAVLVVVLPWLAPRGAGAQAPAVTASASASAESEPPESEPVPLHTMGLEPAGQEAPDRDAWAKATPVSLQRPLPSHCAASVAESWLRVRCTHVHPAAGSVVSGPSKGVVFFATLPTHPKFHYPEIHRAFIEVMMPLRPGESRLVQLTETKNAGGYGGVPSQGSLLLLSQQWPKGSKGPRVRSNHRRWNVDDLLGMTLVDADGAKKLGLKPRTGMTTVGEVRPGSAAAAADLQPGDHLVTFVGTDALIDGLSNSGDDVFRLTIMRDGGATKQVRVPRQPKGPKPL